MLKSRLPDLHMRTLAVLLGLGVAGSIAAAPYFLAIFRPMGQAQGFPYGLLLILVLMLSAAFTLLCVYFGLSWGTSLGLGAPRLQSWALNKVDPGGWRESLGWSVPLALLITAVVWVSQKYWFAGKVPVVGPAGLWQGIAAAIYGGTAEELVLRLFAMTAFAKLLLHLKLPRQRAIVTALFFSAVLSFFFHLPAAMKAGALTWPAFGRNFVHHGLAGMIFGWLYWRRGIEAAMISHGLSDLLLRFALRLG